MNPVSPLGVQLDIVANVKEEAEIFNCVRPLCTLRGHCVALLVLSLSLPFSLSLPHLLT